MLKGQYTSLSYYLTFHRQGMGSTVQLGFGYGLLSAGFGQLLRVVLHIIFLFTK